MVRWILQAILVCEVIWCRMFKSNKAKAFEKVRQIFSLSPVEANFRLTSNFVHNLTVIQSFL